MPGTLRCINALPVKVDGETIVKRCRGDLVPSPEDEHYFCSDEGEEVRFENDVIETFTESPLWHKTCAVNKMLDKLTRLNPNAYNSTYPWIEIPLSVSAKAVVETSSSTWQVHFYRDNHPVASEPTDINTGSEDTETVARSVAEILLRKVQIS